jgi:hypothetical protein
MFLIGIPLNDGNLHIETMKSINALQEKLLLCGIASDIEYNIGSLITRQRNDILQKFHANKKYDYLLFIDNDVSGFEDHIIDLAVVLKNSNRAIAGFTYRKKKFLDLNKNYCENFQKKPNPYNINLHYSIQDTLRKQEKHNLVKVKHLPTGCLLIPKSTFLEMMKYYPDRAKYYNFFDVGVREEQYLSEDYFFCDLLREMGGKVLTNLNINIKHHLSNICFEGSFKEYLNKILSSKELISKQI